QCQTPKAESFDYWPVSSTDKCQRSSRVCSHMTANIALSKGASFVPHNGPLRCVHDKQIRSAVNHEDCISDSANVSRIALESPCSYQAFAFMPVRFSLMSQTVAHGPWFVAVECHRIVIRSFCLELSIVELAHPSLEHI